MPKEQKNQNILVVEDELYVQGMLEDFLTRSGYGVTVVPTAEKAFKSLEEEEVDLILLDKNLPDMSGVEVLSQIRFNNPNLPVIFMTGYPSERSKLMVRHLGVSAYFEKPVNLKVLVQTMEKALDSEESQEPGKEPQILLKEIPALLEESAEPKEEVVLLVTDSEDVKKAIAASSSRDVHLIATSSDVDPVYDYLQNRRAEVLVVDFGLPGGASLALTRWAVKKDPALSVLALIRKEESDAEVKKITDSLGIRYLVKLPVESPRDLMEKMEILVKRTRTLRAFEGAVT